MAELDPTCMVSMVEGRFEDTSRAQLDDIFKTFNQGNRDVLVIHFHGGLVARQSAIDGSAVMNKYFNDHGAQALFPIWETGIFEVLKHNWMEIAAESVFNTVVDRVVRHFLGKAQKVPGAKALGAVAGIQIKKSEFEYSGIHGDFSPDLLGTADYSAMQPLTIFERDRMQMELENDPELVAEFQAVANGQLPETQATTKGITRRASAASLMSPGVVQDLSTTKNSKGIIQAAKVAALVLEIIGKTIGRFIERSDHGVHATVVEEIMRRLYLANVGESIWGVMKGYTVDAFGGDPDVHAGTAMLEAIKGVPANKRILLSGHSAGAIFVVEFLKAAHEAGLNRKFEVALLAPAVRFDRFGKTLAEDLSVIAETDKNGVKTANFRIFSMSDEKESADKLVDQVPWFYPRSLLYFISGILENAVDCPLIGMQRYYVNGHQADRPSVAEVRKYVTGVDGRVAWSIVNKPTQWSANGIDHGDIGHPFMTGNVQNDAFVSIVDIVKNGWS